MLIYENLSFLVEMSFFGKYKKCTGSNYRDNTSTARKVFLSQPGFIQVWNNGQEIN